MSTKHERGEGNESYGRVTVEGNSEDDRIVKRKIIKEWRCEPTKRVIANRVLGARISKLESAYSTFHAR